MLRDGVWATAELLDELGDTLGWLGPGALATAKATLPMVDGSLVLVAATWFDGPNMWTSVNGLDWSPAAEPAALADPSDFPTVTYVDLERIIIRFRAPEPDKHTCWFTSTPCRDIGAQRLEYSAAGFALLSAPLTGYDDTQLVGLTNDGHLMMLGRLDDYSRNVDQRPWWPLLGTTRRARPHRDHPIPRRRRRRHLRRIVGAVRPRLQLITVMYMNVYTAGSTETVSDARKHLTGHVARFRAEGADAEPVVFGDRRKPEAVLLAFETFSMLLEAAEDVVIAQRVRERDAADSGERTSLADAAAEFGIDLDPL